MDDLTLNFAQEAALRQIDECTNVAELKALAKTLIKSHFTSRSYIAMLLLRDIEAPARYAGASQPESSQAP